MSNDGGKNNLRDMLLQYNKISEMCFLQCINTFGQRNMTANEITCSDSCARKYTQFSLKFMSVFVEVQPQIVQKRIEEMQKNQQASAAQEGASSNSSKTEVENNNLIASS